MHLSDSLPVAAYVALSLPLCILIQHVGSGHLYAAVVQVGGGASQVQLAMVVVIHGYKVICDSRAVIAARLGQT